MSRVRPTDDQELGRQVRGTVHDNVDRLRGSTASRDKQLIALVAERHRDAVAILGKTAIVAAGRPLDSGACNWCAARLLAAANGEPMPMPEAGLLGLLGSPCRRCRLEFETQQALESERRLVAAGGRREPAAPAAPAPAPYTRPRYYGSECVRDRRW